MHAAHPATELLTVDDYRATPEGARYQLVAGELVTSPTPNIIHQRIVLNVSHILGNFLDKHPVGEALFAPVDVYLSEHDVVQPDVLFVRRERFGILAHDGLHGAPDLVVEVLSPATAHLDKKAKRLLYAKHGAQELWLVDPLRRQIQVYIFARDPAKPVLLVEDDETFTSALLPGLTIHAGEIFEL